MAKKKSKKNKKKVSGVGAALNPKSPIVTIGSLVAGYLLADKINPAIDKVIPASVTSATSVMSWVVPGSKLAIGSLLLLKKKPSLLTSIPGGLLAGAGLKQALVKVGVISGYQSVPVIGNRMAGYQSVPVVGKLPPQLSGYKVGKLPPQLSGYRVNGKQSVMGSVGSMGTVPGSDYMS